MSMDRTTNNPFTPPKASVADVAQHGDEVYLPPLWSAQGRIGRLRYLCYLGVGYLLLVAGAGLGSGIATAVGGAGLGILSGLISFAALIAFGVFSVLAGIKRAHEMDWSGWTVLAAMLIPFVAFVWIFKAGKPGSNRFGPPPPPNTTGIRIGGLIFPAVFVIGILAAISIPAYSDYQKRARAKQQGGYSQPQEQPAPTGQPGTSSQ